MCLADAYWSWGLYDSLIVVIPSLDIVVARAGKSLNGPRSPHYGPIEPFIEPIALSVKDRGKWPGAPYPESQAIQGVEWAPAGTILRKAEGGDNWPITWADDGNLYTAYGDGQGFEPKVDKKLSVGFAKIVGGPQDFQGRQYSQPDRGVGRGGQCRPQGQRHALRGRRLISAGAECRQLAGSLVGRPRRELALVRLEIRDKLRRPDVLEFRTQITPAGSTIMSTSTRTTTTVPTRRPVAW